MNGTHFMVMAAMGYGWAQVSPMFATRDQAEQHMTTHLSDSKVAATGRNVKVKGNDITGKVLRVFEFR